MIVDGKGIAREIEARLTEEIRKSGRSPRLTVFFSVPNAATAQFLSLKRKRAEGLGVKLFEKSVEALVGTREFAELISKEAARVDGIIVQLPLPASFDTEEVLSAIPFTHDVDVLSAAARGAFAKGEFPILPPVVAAIKEIMEQYKVGVSGKRVVVVGRGKLVGEPSARWFERRGGEVTLVSPLAGNLSEVTAKADIIVLGAGIPKLLAPSMIKDGVVILDAGTSESAGQIVGDADPACAKKAALITPVPGGIGPITVAMIFKNLLTLAGSSL